MAGDSNQEFYMNFNLIKKGRSIQLDKIRFGPHFVARVEKHLDQLRQTEKTKKTRCVAIKQLFMKDIVKNVYDPVWQNIDGIENHLFKYYGN